MDISGCLDPDFSQRPRNAQTSRRHECRSRTSGEGEVGNITGNYPDAEAGRYLGACTVCQSQRNTRTEGGFKTRTRQGSGIRMAWRNPSFSLPRMQLCLLATLRQVGISKITTLTEYNLCPPNRDTARQGAALQVQRRHGGPKHGGEKGTRQECRLLRASDGIPQRRLNQAAHIPLVWHSTRLPLSRSVFEAQQNERRTGNRMNEAMRLQKRRQQIQAQPWFRQPDSRAGSTRYRMSINDQSVRVGPARVRSGPFSNLTTAARTGPPRLLLRLVTSNSQASPIVRDM